MQNKRHRLAGTIGIAVLGLFGISVTLSEIPLLPENQRAFYAIGKAILVLATIPLAILYWKKSASYWVNLAIGVLFAVYTLFGQWHRPLYVFSFQQLVFAMSFIYTLPKKTFRVFVCLWGFVFLAVVRLQWIPFQEQMKVLVYSDFVFVTAVVAFISILAHTYFTAERVFRETTLNRFSRMGFQTSRLIHDLKGLTSAPRVYSDLLKSRLGSNLDPVVTEALSSLSSDLENLNRVVVELNQLSIVKGQGEYTTFHFTDVIAAVKTLLGARIKFIEIQNHVKLKLHADQSILNSVLLNLLMNSLENFNQREIQNPRITIRKVGSKIIFSDNGGGFSKNVIQAINSGSSTSTRSRGGGLGLWMIRDGMEILDGKVTFGNNDEGVSIALTLPNKSVSTEHAIPEVELTV